MAAICRDWFKFIEFDIWSQTTKYGACLFNFIGLDNANPHY